MSRHTLIYTIGFSLLALILGVSVYLYYKHPQVNEVHEHHHAEHAEHQEDKEELSRINLSEDQIKKLGIELRTANKGDLFLTLNATGKIILPPDQLAYILPTVSGTMQEARKNVGQFVRAGEIIAIIDSKEMAEAKSNYLRALSEEQTDWSSLEREKKLYEKGISSQQEYIQAKNEYRQSTIHSQFAKQKLYTLGLKDQDIASLPIQDPSSLRLYEMRAPIDGIIINRTLVKGQMIDNSNNQPVYQIADLSRLWVDIGIFAKDFFKLREGQIVHINLPNQELSAKAHLIYLNPIIEDQSILTKAIAVLDNHLGHWYPGTFVKVNIETQQITSPLIVPKSALQTIDGETYIFKVIDGGFEKKLVQTGRSDQNHIEITSGLEINDQYAATNSFILKAELNKNSIEHED
jgi:cobalt-zinc-cadmium efflux system membrane fusion protein